MEVQMAEPTSLEQLKKRVRDFVEDRDWGQFHSPRNLAMALSVECSELLELYLWCTDDGQQPITTARKERVAGEVGDILMCLLNFCHQADIDLLQALSDKLHVAEQKYPVEQVRGLALKYNEYNNWTGDGPS
jgi:dCTP diphosphatase